MSKNDKGRPGHDGGSRFDTIAVRTGQVRSPEGEHNDPIFLTSSFVFENARQAAARFSDEEPGNVYSRFTNPTVRTFEERLAALEGGSFGVGTASGMSAILTTCLTLLKAGDHVVCASGVFGSTVGLLNNIIGKFGVTTTFVDLTDLDQWAGAIRPETRLLLLESPSNPLGEVADLAALADLAHDRGCLLVVDNCFCTPALQRPFEFGADVVIHSATKFLDGQGRCVGGAIVVDDEEMYKQFFACLRTSGSSMSPFNAWVFLKGLETLRLRMKAHSANALALAEWLEEQDVVAKVYFTGLKSNPQHELASRQQSDFGGVVAFDLHGGRREAWTVIDATRMLSITANLGDAKTTITHPASTTHGRISAEERARAGIGECMVRVAAGLEDVEDVKADLARGFDLIRASAAESVSGA